MSTAAIIGGGVIGGGWAARFLLMGWDVRVFDPDPDAGRKLDAVLANARRALPGLFEVALPEEGKLSFHAEIADAVEGADYIQESVPERLDIKHKVLAEIQQSCAPEAVIGSSTSGFKPSELQDGALRPEQILVAHPFNPVYLLPLVELVPLPKSTSSYVGKAQEILKNIGMKPLLVRAEIDAHIADRFLEAVWREALWLVKDDIATTEEIDDAIRYGFGLRWAQMGLFETYRLAGGEAGMAHFIAQFGPCLEWPWTKLMDVPDLTPELIQKIADQSDAQSGAHSIRDLERIRDDNLVAMMRALKPKSWGAGAVLADMDQRLSRKPAGAPLVTIERVIPTDWTDYNGHMNESRYGQLYSDAADAVMLHIGADADYIASGLSYFTVDIHIRFLAETHAGDAIKVISQVLVGEGKKLKLHHSLLAEDGRVLSTGEQMLLHVSLETRKTCLPSDDVAGKLAALAAEHADLPPPSA